MRSVGSSALRIRFAVLLVVRPKPPPEPVGGLVCRGASLAQ
ncbi:MAG TPA: hypothetical protein VID48_10975 [Solirubrobacteraceae bacterium]